MVAANHDLQRALSIGTTALDGVKGGARGVLLLRDGTLRGGDSFFYFLGTYSCFDGKWKGEMISQDTPRPLFPDRWQEGW